MGTEFSLGKWKVQETDGGESCTTMWTSSVPLKCTVKHGLNSMFYIMWLLPQ